MQYITSQDGTRIGYDYQGHGSPLILVHGGTADHTRWAPVLPALAEHFSVYAMDRRGRGASGDTEPYALEREVEDVATLVASLGGAIDVLGHSFGGVCALEAARLSPYVRRLVLYEPPPTGVKGRTPSAVQLKMAQLLTAGDREGVITTFLQDIVHVPPRELAILRAAPGWQMRVATAHTILREIAALEAHPAVDAARFRMFQTPTLLLLGGNSPEYLSANTAALQRALPISRIRVLPGQQHSAMNTAPDLFVQEVVTFLTEPA